MSKRLIGVSELTSGRYVAEILPDGTRSYFGRVTTDFPYAAAILKARHRRAHQGDRFIHIAAAGPNDAVEWHTIFYCPLSAPETDVVQREYQASLRRRA